MAGNKRTTIQKLTVLQTRLMLVGIVLAVACGVCTVLLRHEKEPEPELILPVETVPFMPGAWTGQPSAKKTQPEPSKAEEPAQMDETTAPVLENAETNETAPEPEISEDTEHSFEPVAANVPGESSDPVVAENTEAVAEETRATEETRAAEETTATEATTATEPIPEAPESQIRPTIPAFPPMTAPMEEPQEELKPAEKHLSVWFFAAIFLDVLLGINLVMLVLLVLNRSPY